MNTKTGSKFLFSWCLAQKLLCISFTLYFLSPNPEYGSKQAIMVLFFFGVQKFILDLGVCLSSDMIWFDACLLWLTLLLPWLNCRETVVVMGNEAMVWQWKIKTGGRIVAVVIKSDKAPEALVEKVTDDDVNIGLSYVCIRNRIGEESYKEARVEEVRLFESHPLLSKIDKSIVGISILAQKLTQIQTASIARNLPATVKTERFELGLCITMVESEREQKLSNSEIVFPSSQLYKIH